MQKQRLSAVRTGIPEEYLALAKFLDASSDPTIAVDSEGKILFLNDLATSLFQYPEEELAGQHINMLVPEGRRDHHVKLVADFYATREARSIDAGMELAALRKDGIEVPVEIGLSPVRINDVTITLCAVRDISERKKVEEQLRQSIERYELAVRGTQDGIWDWNIQTGVGYHSPRWTGILGYQEDELEPHVDAFTALLHPEDRERAWQAIEAHLERRAPYDIEYRLRHKNGNFIWVHAQGQAKWNDAGEPVRMVGSISDITERKELETEVHGLLARLDALTQVAFDGIVVSGFGLIEEVSGQFAATLGYQIDELVGQPLLRFIAPQYKSIARKNMKAQRTETHQLILIKKDGSRLPMEACGTNVTVGKRMLRVSAFRNISRRVELEREVTATSERERRRIGQDLHDGLGQELTGISMGLQLLCRKLNDDQSPHGQALEHLIAKTQKMIGELARVASILSPVFLLQRGFKAAVRGLAEGVNQYSNVRCQFQCSGERCIHDAEVATQLYRITQEAINNAQKHANAQNIDLCCNCDARLVHLVVLDDGIGIPPEPDRVDGMGLKNMRYRARMIDGSLEITARKGGGTRVSCSCPIPD